jgi:hypothetical protein
MSSGRNRFERRRNTSSGLMLVVVGMTETVHPASSGKGTSLPSFAAPLTKGETSSIELQQLNNDTTASDEEVDDEEEDSVTSDALSPPPPTNPIAPPPGGSSTTVHDETRS